MFEWNTILSNFTTPGLLVRIFISLFQFVVILTSHNAETDPTTRAQYSKFAKQDESSRMVSSRIGMLIIYTPSIFFSLIVSIATHGLLEFPVANILCILHFVKRDLEVLFLHIYSGKVSLGVSTMIGTYYTITASAISYVSAKEVSHTEKRISILLFVVGSIGNCYHHYLLAKLRSDGNNKKIYLIPQGGMFNYVTAPHYFFELIAWLGMAVASRHFNIYLVFLSMCSYLSGRAVAQSQFYKDKFADEWSETKKILVPFLY